MRDGFHLDGPNDARWDEPWPGFRIRTVPLITCGVGDADLEGQGDEAWPVAVRGLHPALRSRAPPHVVVLGDEALRRLRPSAMGPLLRRPGCVPLACARACPAHVIADWVRCCSIEFVAEGRLPRRVAMACRLDGELHPDEESIIVSGRSEEMRKALVALRRTNDFRVKLWASAFRKSRHALRRLCGSALDLTPEEIAWATFDARVRREMLLGRSDAQVAASVGFANAYSLRRAYARRGLPLPRP